MGDPRKIRKKYQTPMHPWEGKRIEEEKGLSREYGLKNKKEIWKMRAILKGFSDQAKKLIAAKGSQSEREKEQLFSRMTSLGLIQAGATLDDVLGLTIRDILERRLQTRLYKKGLARSVKQARQFIIHQHVRVDDKKITMPSYLVPIELESSITFSEGSSVSDPEHPERVILSESKAKKAAGTEDDAEVSENKEEAKAVPDKKSEKKADKKAETKEDIKEKSEPKKKSEVAEETKEEPKPEVPEEKASEDDSKEESKEEVKEEAPVEAEKKEDVPETKEESKEVPDKEPEGSKNDAESSADEKTE